MSFLTRLLLVTLLTGSCIPQNPEDFILFTLESIAARQDGLLKKFDELDSKIGRKIDELDSKLEKLDRKMEGKIDELDSKMERKINDLETKIETQIQEQCCTKDQISSLQELITTDECVEGRPSCNASATCKDVIGHYKCVYMSGYSGDKLTCEDVNECTEVTDICGEGGICINHPGTYGCLCQIGFIEINNSCTDVNECEDSSNICGDELNCINFLGNYSCSCNEGFRKQENTCQDINECETTNHLCHANATCTNTRGGYTCECLPYYYGDGFTCNDINECETTNHLCHANATCTNTRGGYTCECLPYYYGDGFTCNEIRVSNCKKLLDKGVIQSGVYTIIPEGFPGGVEVYCDQETSDGGWTVILQRKKQRHQLHFNKTFQQYASGFGNPNGEFWIGNRVLHSMTGEEPFTLRVEAKNLQGESRTGIWETFSVGSEDTEFTLSIAGYSSSSTLGDGLWKPSRSKSSANNMKFSTFDRDNDRGSGGSCSALRGQGGWWYNDCYGANPTAPFGDSNGDYNIANWYFWESSSLSGSIAILEIQFMIRP